MYQALSTQTILVLVILQDLLTTTTKNRIPPALSFESVPSPGEEEKDQYTEEA